MLKCFCLTFGVILITIGFINGEQSPSQYSKVKISIINPGDIKALQIAGLGLDHFKVTDNHIEAVLSNKEIDILNITGRYYEILIVDVIEHYNQHIRMSDEELIPLKKK